jgi:Transposase DDE domain
VFLVDGNNTEKEVQAKVKRNRLSQEIITDFRCAIQTVGAGCPKPSQKFLWSVTLGLAMAGNVMVSEVARKLIPFRGITFHALHKGLCRGLKSPRWGAWPVQEAYLKQAGRHLGRNRVIACDLGDITKPRVRRMPGIQTVRDGSTGQMKKGWWLLEIEAMHGQGRKHLPLWLELFSVSRRGYKSQWVLIEKAIRTLVEQMGRWGLWIFDRGFDSERFFAFLGELKIQFLVRANAKRCVIDPQTRRRRSLSVLARGILEKAPFLWRRRWRSETLLMKAGFCVIEMEHTHQRLCLIAVQGFGQHPFLLLTSRLPKSAQQAAELAKCYIQRWGVEEAGRLVKQAFRLENIRVLSWAGLVKLVWCAMWTYGLLCLVRFRKKLNRYREILKAYPGFGPTPPFPYYRLAGAVAWLLFVTSLTEPSLLATALKSG